MDFKRSLPASLYQQVTTPPRYRFTSSNGAADGTVTLDRRWTLVLDGSCGPLAELAANDLRTQLADNFKVKLAARAKGEERLVQVRVEPDGQAGRERYHLDVQPQRITITAADDEGAMRALFHLGWEMLNRRAPVVAQGSWRRQPRWALRITSPLLHRPRDEAEDYLDLPEAYLLNMARYGYNATYLYADWFDFMTPKVAGPLARPGARQRLRRLKETVDYLGRFGIRLLFHVNTLALPPDHRQFQQQPNTRGAQTWHEGLHCLCSSAPAVKQLYRDAAEQLFADVPGLAGAVLITGGECFLHCYTRPVPKTDGRTNCPRCAKRAPETVIADVVNAVADGAQAANPDARILMWPYSAFSWGDTAAQERLVEQLGDRVTVQGVFEKDMWLTIDGVRSYVFDYSASQVGPSPVFKALKRGASRSGRELWAKTETSNALEMFNVPRIPVMQRWAERFGAIRDAGVTGVHTTWRFYGFCAQRTDEVVDYFNWARKPDAEAFLERVAARDFGPRSGKRVVRAWRRFSEAFTEFPYAAGTIGFPYFRGPFFIGAAHPFLIDLTAAPRLSERFWALDPSLGEAFDDPERISAARMPTFFMDLTWTVPLGPAIVERQLAKLCRGWGAGLRELERARPEDAADRQRWQDELDVATFIDTMCTTALHLVRFQQLRQQIVEKPLTPARLRSACRRAEKILTDEHANAERALAAVERQPALGYGATYGTPVDADLLREKLAHTRHQIDEALPGFYSNIMFHAFGISTTWGAGDEG